MTIRLTSIEAFERVLERLKQHDFYDEETNASFFKYCVDTIKEGLLAADDEWYLDVDYIHINEYPYVVMAIRYHRRSEIPTDEETLTEP